MSCHLPRCGEWKAYRVSGEAVSGSPCLQQSLPRSAGWVRSPICWRRFFCKSWSHLSIEPCGFVADFSDQRGQEQSQCDTFPCWWL